MKNQESIGDKALSFWTKLSPYPGGRWLFSKLVGLMIPYTGSMRPIVMQIEPGYAQVHLPDRRRVRNHLRSIHAIALANLAEFTTGLATLTGAPADSRAILVRLDISYHKKARGTLRSECRSTPPTSSEEQELPVEAFIYDESGDCVATGTATWLIGPAANKQTIA